MSTAVRKLNKESTVTVLTLLRSFYDQEAFLHLTKEFYNSDLDISLTAIRSSAVIGNEFAVPHLYTMIEKGKREQKIEAIKTLAVIRAPSSIEKLVKYFHLFPEKEIRLEIVGTLTAIGSEDGKYREMIAGLVQDANLDEKIRVAASDGLIAFASDAQLRDLMKTVPLTVRQNLIRKALLFSPERAALFFEHSQDAVKSLDVESLGRFLAGYLLYVRQADQKTIITALAGKTRGAIVPFLTALLDCPCEIVQPLKVFKTLLILPYLNRETEKLTGQNLEKIVEIMRERSPYVLNELGTITIAHLEALSGKIKKNFLSLGGIQQKEGLLSLLFARLIENYATPGLLEDVQRYFKGIKYIEERALIADVRKALADATEVEKNQFKACLGLFNPDRKADQLKTQTMLSNVDLARPFLLRRLNRFVRLAGLLGIKTMIKNIQRILDFARNERIAYLEETTVVSLCQLYDKPSLDRAAAFLARPLESIPSLKGYVRGLRFCLPPFYLKELGELLLKQEIPADIQLCVIDTIGCFDPKLTRGVIPSFIKALFLPKRDPLVAGKLESVLLARAEANVFQVMLGFLNSKDRFIRLLAIKMLREIAVKDTALPREVLINRYYLLLEEDDPDIKQESLVALLCLKDDYAIQVFGDYFKPENLGDVPALLERLPHPLMRDAVHFLFKQIALDDAGLQATLRHIFLEVSKSDSAEELRNVLLDLLNTQLGKVFKFQPDEKQMNGTGIMEQAKLEFKFKRENTQTLTVFFCDIVSYTEKSSIVDTSTLMTLIRSFEGIVFPLMKEFRGQVVKTFGDGILSVFKHPLNAVLAAISVQKKIHEYNQFKVDDEKIFLRIGLNTGLVIRKQNDVFGDAVNIASRMQAAANPGDILLTHDTYSEIQNYIKCTPLGKIKVKGKEEAIAAYAAQEVKVDFNHLLKTNRNTGAPMKKGAAVDPITNLKESMFTPTFAAPETVIAGKGLLKEIERLFQSVTAAVEELAKDYHEEYEFKRYLQKRWDLLVKNWDRHLAGGVENAPRVASS